LGQVTGERSQTPGDADGSVALLLSDKSVRPTQSALALAGVIGGDFEPVAAELHAAPAAGSFFAGVEEVEDAGVALTDASGIGVGEEGGGSVDDGGEEVVGLTWLEGVDEFEGFSGLGQTGGQRVRRQQVVEAGESCRLQSFAVFQTLDLLAEVLAELAQAPQSELSRGCVREFSLEARGGVAVEQLRGAEPAEEAGEVGQEFFGFTFEDGAGIEEVEGQVVSQEEEAVLPVGVLRGGVGHRYRRQNYNTDNATYYRLHHRM